MSAKRPPEGLLKSPFKTRRSIRLLLLGLSSETELKSRLDRDEIALKNEAEIKVEYDGSVVNSLIPEPLTPDPGSFLVSEVTTKDEIKEEQSLDVLPPTPHSESPKLTPRSGNTFYSQIGSNVFEPVSPSHVTDKQPKNWSRIYNEIVKMRALIFTPVDSFGCERLPDSITPGMSSTDPKTYRFQLLLSLMLSAQTKDETNFAAMKNLQQHFKKKGFPGICLEAVLDSTEAEIDHCIAKVGFHRRKAQYIKKSCEILKQNFDGEIPKTIEEIVTLPGVGPKMGHLILQNGWSINSGIGVDVHIHRLAQMWGWVPKSEKPELTRTTLEGWLPKQYWADINPLLVGFGQTVCAPKANNCDICFLSNGLCKGSNRKLANAPLKDARIKKLERLRGDLTNLVRLKLEKQKMDA